MRARSELAFSRAAMHARRLMTFRRVAAAASLLSVLAVAIVVPGCGGGGKKSTQPVPTGPPNPNSPVNAVLLLQYAIQHRDTSLYKQLFPTQYQFTFQPGDTAALNYFGGNWGYLEERQFATHLFNTGSPGNAYATSITIPFSPSPLTDAAVVGQSSTYHRRVDLQMVLTIQKSDASAEQIVGGSAFFLVRGDSASLPADLIAAGVQATSGRWFIEGWTDQTGGVRPQYALRPGPRPARSTATSLPTIGELKVHYLP